MYGYIYRTHNKVNRKMYIGKHKSPTFDNKYYGSGKLLWRAIEKYGIENFYVEVLKWCNNLEELNKSEEYYIKKYNSVSSENYYNIAKGGAGGFEFNGINVAKTERVRQILREQSFRLHTPEVQGRIDRKGKNNPMYGRHTSEKQKKAVSDYQKLHRGINSPQYGKKLSEETKSKMSKVRKGRINVTNGIETHVINSSELDKYLAMGYYKGRHYKIK